jgi:formylglycine-generating enzyme
MFVAAFGPTFLLITVRIMFGEINMFHHMNVCDLAFVLVFGLGFHCLSDGCAAPSPTPAPTSKPTTSKPTPLPPSKTLTITCGKGVQMTLVKIPAGTFRMGDIAGNGSSDEKPVHNVTISKDYYLGISEVTQAQWKAVMGTEPWKGQDCVKEQGDCPATNVDWNDAVAFCTKLKQLNPGRTFRLPTEAEWERACRAGTETVYYFGDDISILGNYAWGRGNAWSVNEKYAHAVGKKIKNSYGLFDMHGNVWEWCSDWYSSSYYNSSPSIDPTGPSSGTYRVIRGGSWGYWVNDCRSSFRGYVWRAYAHSGVIGFRVVLEN